MQPTNFFKLGFREMLPITPGALPFGAVMGTVCANAGLNLWDTVCMNFFVYAGAAQLASTELMTKHAATLVVVATGLFINSRFLLYSAALSPALQGSSWRMKSICAHLLTDQGYAVMSANEDRTPDMKDKIQLYLGASVCMWITWQLAVLSGFLFGNIAPSSWSLDYAVPLSFAALVIPTLKNRNYIYVAAFSSVVSILLNGLPFRLGLITTALIAITFAAFLTRKKVQR